MGPKSTVLEHDEYERGTLPTSDSQNSGSLHSCDGDGH